MCSICFWYQMVADGNCSMQLVDMGINNNGDYAMSCGFDCCYVTISLQDQFYREGDSTSIYRGRDFSTKLTHNGSVNSSIL